jgi:cold shock CspA family protein
VTSAAPAPHLAGGQLTGTVKEFDAAVGWGVVTGEGADYPFHSTAIADGTRLIDVDTAVAFEVAPGRMGRWEGSGLRAL